MLNFLSVLCSDLELAELLDSFITSLIGCLDLSLQIFHVYLQLLLGCCCCGPLLTFILQLRLQLTDLQPVCIIAMITDAEIAFFDNKSFTSFWYKNEGFYLPA